MGLCSRKSPTRALGDRETIRRAVGAHAVAVLEEPEGEILNTRRFGDIAVAPLELFPEDRSKPGALDQADLLVPPGGQLVQQALFGAARGKRAYGIRKKMKQLGAPDIVEADFVERSAYRRNWRRLMLFENEQ